MLDFVEIASSFYRTPNEFMIKNWSKKTPTNFRFTAKFPKVITHDKRSKDVENELESFFSSMVNLEDKIFLFQMFLILEYMARQEDIE